MIFLCKLLDENRIKILLELKDTGSIDNYIKVRELDFDVIIFPDITDEYEIYEDQQYRTYLDYHLSAENKLSSISDLISLSNRVKKISKSKTNTFKKSLNELTDKPKLIYKDLNFSDSHLADLNLSGSHLAGLKKMFDEIELCELTVIEPQVNSYIKKQIDAGNWVPNFKTHFIGLIVLFIEMKLYQKRNFALQKLVERLISSDLKEPVFSTSTRYKEEYIIQDRKQPLYKEFWDFLDEFWLENETELRSEHDSAHSIANEVLNQIKIQFPNRTKYPSNSSIRSKLGFKKS